MRVVTIRHPPPAVEGVPPDNSKIGETYDLPAQLAILMLAAGWVRNDTRSLVRRHREQEPLLNRRQANDRRSMS